MVSISFYRTYVKEIIKLNNMYSDGRQHCANEFLGLLLDSMRTKLPYLGNPVINIFEFNMVEIRRCNTVE